MPPTGVNKDQRLHLLTIVDFRQLPPRTIVNTWTARVSSAEEAPTLREDDLAFWQIQPLQLLQRTKRMAGLLPAELTSKNDEDEPCNRRH